MRLRLIDDDAFVELIGLMDGCGERDGFRREKRTPPAL